MARLVLVFNLVDPNLVCAKVAVVKVSGAAVFGKNAVMGDASRVLKGGVGELEEYGDDDFGLMETLLKEELRLSMGLKHCASGLKVLVTSLSKLSSWVADSAASEYKILINPFSPIL